MDKKLMGAILKIGFNNSVAADSGELHVQTEVVVRGGILIRTTVLQGGVIKLTKTEPCPESAEAVSEIAGWAEAQHAKYVGMASSGQL